MPTCPNCGSIVPEGSSTCSCGTPLGRNIPYVDEEALYHEFTERLKWENSQKFKERAIELENEGRYLEAIKNYRTAKELGESFLMYEHIARCYLKAGMYEKALEEYEDLGWTNFDGKGQALIALERYDDAIQNYWDAIEELNSSSAYTIKKREDRLDDPDYVDWFNEKSKKLADERDELISKAYKGIGWAYHIKGENEKAIEYFEKAIGYDYNCSDNWNCKAISLQATGQYVEALKFFDIAFEMSDCDDAIRNNRRECIKEYGIAYRNKTYTEGCKYLKEALAITEDYSPEDSNDSGHHQTQSFGGATIMNPDEDI